MNNIEVSLLNPEQAKDLYVYWSKFAAKCYDTTINPDKPEAVGKHCHATGHTSGSRTTYFIFEITGISRACTAQLNRHSIGTVVNEQSMRYVNFSNKDIKVPPSIHQDYYTRKLFTQTSELCKSTYLSLVNSLQKLGRTHEQAKEDARYILPMGTETEGCWAFDIEALEHFCNVRLCERAQWEIREVARQMKKEVIKVQPSLERKLVPNCKKLGYCPENNQQCKNMSKTIPTYNEFAQIMQTKEYKQLVEETKNKKKK